MQSRFSDIKIWIETEKQYLKKVIEADITFSEKSSYADIVTMHDMVVENSLKSQILSKYPHDTIVGEESDQHITTEDCEYVWYIDPIDGTTNFVYQKNYFTISVACFKRGQCIFGVVLDVINNNMYHAFLDQGAYKNQSRIHVNTNPKDFHDVILYTPIIQDTFINNHQNKKFFTSLANEVCAIRSIGCISMELCLLAEGKASMFIGMRSNPWDHNAAALIVGEAGGYVNQINSNSLFDSYRGSIVAFSNDTIRKLFFCGIK